MTALQEAVARRDFTQAAEFARQNLALIDGFVRSQKAQYGSFDIRGIPALEVGGTVLALAGDDTSLADMRALVASTGTLKPWRDVVRRHVEDRQLIANILTVIAGEPGCRQKAMKARLGVEDGHRVARLIGWMDKASQLTRTKRGTDYELWLPDAMPAARAAPTALATAVRSHRTGTVPHLRLIDATRLPYIPLPRAPSHWEDAQAGHASLAIPTPTEAFEVHGAPTWSVSSVHKLPMGERPDPAFRRLLTASTGVFAVDDRGKSKGFDAAAAALRYDRSGALAASHALAHDTYRLDANPLGCGFIALSRAGVLHAYRDDLTLLFETGLRDAPEVVRLRKRFEIPDDKLKNHIRCVALSAQADRYLFTIVDQVSCVGVDGRGLWGARLPVTDEWTRIAESSDMAGTSDEVNDALALLGLSLPFSPEDVKTRYRLLAKQWHPDVNPHDPAATTRMQTLTAAAQLVTGITGPTLAADAGARYGKVLSQSEVTVGDRRITVTASMNVSERDAADWIYAASFGGTTNAVFVVGYSGRVVALSADGIPMCVYDIGAVPRRIVDTDDHLYLLTDTRLYVLRNQKLYALVDTFNGGELVMGQTGFGLLEAKRFRWFSEDGIYQGSVVSQDPIRRVYASPDGITVETRTRRARIKGPPAWWG